MGVSTLTPRVLNFRWERTLDDTNHFTSTKPGTIEEPSLSMRQQVILRLIVREYVATGRPVGSKSLVESSSIGVSPATMRNEMAALEELGYLEHLHTSGGRIPTDRGYRYFVAHLMGETELPSSEQLTILHQFRQVELQLEQWIELAAATLAHAAGNVSLVSVPMPQSPRLRHIELVALQPRLGLVILVTTDGAVRQVMAHWPEDADQETLSPLADSLAAALRGLTPDEVVTHAVGAGGLARAALDQIAVALQGMTASGAPVRHSGLEHVLTQPEFSDAAEAQELLSLLGGGSFLSAMLPRLEEGPGVQVFIGHENPADELQRLGIVVSTYGVDGDVVGVLGVVGPTRMAYDRSISSVRYMARLMSDLMADLRAG
ncbi:MAG: heat-inducible transcription repressor HrcA [Chloroflexia bacterium]|nr:heat-inducible transcription repressor HrcA [Chloroflexia bacterium]